MQHHREVHRGYALCVVIGAVALGASGCGDDDGGRVPTSDPSAGRDADAAAGGGDGTPAAAGASGGGAGGMRGDDGADGDGLEQLELSDGQIAGVMLVAHAGEIEQGGIAVERAADDDVREFAMRMLDEHEAATMRLSMLLNTTGVVAMVSALGQEMMTDSMYTAAVLRQRTGAAFDVAYMQAQRAAHARVLEIIDQVLLPDVDHMALRTELELLRAAVSEHLDEAEDVRQDLREPD